MSLTMAYNIWQHCCSAPATLTSCAEQSPALGFALGWLSSWEALPSSCRANALTSFKPLLKCQLFTKLFPNHPYSKLQVTPDTKEKLYSKQDFTF